MFTFKQSIVALITFAFLVLSGFSNLGKADSKYRLKSKKSETSTQPEPVPIEPFPPEPTALTEESIDSWFTTGFNDFSLHKLRFLLPSFIEVLPESQLTGDLKWDVEGLSILNVHADIYITGIRIHHPGLAVHPVDIPDLYLKGIIRWNRAEKTLSFEHLNVGRRGVMMQLTGLVSYKNMTMVQLNLSLPDTEIQNALNALPSDLIPKLQGAQIQGTIGMNMFFSADPAHPQELKFEPGIRISNYALLREPLGVNILALKTDHIHLIWKNDFIIRQILLSHNNPEYVSYDQLGENVRHAILKAEDISFFSHHGFNLDEIRQAGVRNLRTKKFVWGGSTITMQLAKNLFLNGSKTLSRKLQEAILAYALEEELTKQKILELYANIIEWGVNVYGISEASNHYFSKKPSSLTKAEAALLASIIPSPQKRDFKQEGVTIKQNETTKVNELKTK